MTHELPKLSYEYNALEPHMDAQTMQIHYEKHHQAYVDKLNVALEKYPDLQEKSIKDLLTGLGFNPSITGIKSQLTIPEDIRTAVRNNGGGHHNHTLFWAVMGPSGGGEPDGALAEAINSSFGDFRTFKEKFSAAALGIFGSGWTWLVKNSSGGLEITTTPNQDNPAMSGQKSLLGLDVWEHAYYLKHQNKRADYVESWWNVVNWEEVARRFSERQ